MRRLLFLTWILASAAIGERPNIVLILCDDLGYADVGFNGAKDIQTPALDRLAKDGTICTSGYVAHPFCGPSRMGMMSGRYPHSFGAPFNLPGHGPDNGLGIPEEETMISQVLQEAGYFTGCVGKWHLGKATPFHPNTRGFDEFYGFLGGGHHYFPDQYRPLYEKQKRAGKKHIWDYLTPLEHNGKEVQETAYITDALSREGVRFVEKAAKKEAPFFLFLSYNAPHSPLEAKEEDLAKYQSIKDDKRRTYAAMVHALDRGIDQVVKALEASHQLKDTLIVFLSDNGGKESLGADNGPLREGKGSVFEGGSRVPMFFHWPNKIPAGAKFAPPISSLDFYPTFAKLAKAPLPARKHLDGKDILTALQTQRDPRQGEPLFTLRHRNGYTDVGIRQDQWKASKAYETKWKLYNIVEDLSEEHDLSAKHATKLEELVSKASHWNKPNPQPQWFDSPKVESQWKQARMPKNEATFQIE